LLIGQIQHTLSSLTVELTGAGVLALLPCRKELAGAPASRLYTIVDRRLYYPVGAAGLAAFAGVPRLYYFVGVLDFIQMNKVFEGAIQLPGLGFG